MNKVIVNVQIWRTWKEISKALGCTVEHAKYLAKKRGMPVRMEGSRVVLCSVDYLDWHAKQPLYFEQKSK